MASIAAAVSADIAARPAPWCRGWLRTLQQAWRLQRERRELMNLNDRMLADIGVTRCDAVREGSKWVWQPPHPIGHVSRTGDDMRLRS